MTMWEDKQRKILGAVRHGRVEDRDPVTIRVFRGRCTHAKHTHTRTHYDIYLYFQAVYRLSV